MKLGEEAGDEEVKKEEEKEDEEDGSEEDAKKGKEGELLADSFDLRDLINICLKYSCCPRSPPHKGRCPRKKIRKKSGLLPNQGGGRA